MRYFPVSHVTKLTYFSELISLFLFFFFFLALLDELSNIASDEDTGVHLENTLSLGSRTMTAEEERGGASTLVPRLMYSIHLELIDAKLSYALIAEITINFQK